MIKIILPLLISLIIGSCESITDHPGGEPGNDPGDQDGNRVVSG